MLLRRCLQRVRAQPGGKIAHRAEKARAMPEDAGAARPPPAPRPSFEQRIGVAVAIAEEGEPERRVAERILGQPVAERLVL